jgi:branched-subunit amino acid ABC-type transport system permease component
LLGILIYAVAVHRVINAPHLSSLLATFSVNMIIIGLGTAALTTSPYNVDFSAGSIKLGSVTLLGTRLIAALVAMLEEFTHRWFIEGDGPGQSAHDVVTAAETLGTLWLSAIGLERK